MTLWSVLLVAVCSLLGAVVSREVVCYYGSWAVYTPGEGEFTGDKVDPKLCTQLVYAFLHINSNGDIIDLDPAVSTSKYQLFAKFREHRTNKPSLKLVAAIGGWNETVSTYFSKVAGDDKLRKKFAENAVAFLNKEKFDGIDIDWEYPNKVDKANFVSLLKELAKAFVPKKYLLTVAVGATEWRVDESYDVKGISDNVNFINLMTYDMQGTYGVTRHHAALTQGLDTDDKRSLNVEAVIKNWLSKGATASKLNLGIPFYGRSFKLADPKQDGLGAKVSGVGKTSVFTGEAGSLTYYEICKPSPFSQKKFDSRVGAYASGGGEWVSYDNVQSIELKCDVIAKNGLGGGMVWAINQDDFSGKCSTGNFPLLTALKNCVNKVIPVSPSEPYVRPVENDVPFYQRLPYSPGKQDFRVKPPVIKPGLGFICPSDGYFTDPLDCKQYYQCYNGGLQWAHLPCPEGLLFNEDTSKCDYPENVNC